MAGSSSVLRLYPEAGFVGFTAVVDTGNASKSSEVECEGRRENEGKRKVEGALLGPPPRHYQGPSHSPSVARLSGSMTESSIEGFLHGPLAGLSA